MNPFSYLALGDSYTIGEAVPLLESFPYQVVQQLRLSNVDFQAPEIIAKTGWTTAELLSTMRRHSFLDQYDIVTLLTGVNNQYRKLPFDQYRNELKQLIKAAIILAGNRTGRVVLISIPDYGLTPFSATLNATTISKELWDYNLFGSEIAQQNGIHYLNIGDSFKHTQTDASLLAPDGLHPSAKEYQKWAILLRLLIQKSLKEDC